jgi:hypothetical protein
VSASKSDDLAVVELLLLGRFATGCRNAGLRMVGEGVRDSGGELEAVRDIGIWMLCRETPELSASMIVDSSCDSGIPGEGVRSVGAE